MNFATTQTVLTITFNAIATVGIAYLTFAFVVEAVARWNAIGQEAQRPQDVEQLQDDIVTDDMQPVVQTPDLDITLDELQEWDQRLAIVTSQPTMEDRIIPFIHPKTTVAKLRSLFSRKGLTWRNAGIDGKHLRKADMVRLLMEVSAA